MVGASGLAAAASYPEDPDEISRSPAQAVSVLPSLDDQQVSRGCRAVQPLGVGEDHVAIGGE